MARSTSIATPQAARFRKTPIKPSEVKRHWTRVKREHDRLWTKRIKPEVDALKQRIQDELLDWYSGADRVLVDVKGQGQDVIQVVFDWYRQGDGADWWHVEWHNLVGYSKLAFIQRSASQSSKKRVKN